MSKIIIKMWYDAYEWLEIISFKSRWSHVWKTAFYRPSPHPLALTVFQPPLWWCFLSLDGGADGGGSFDIDILLKTEYPTITCFRTSEQV